MGGAGFLDEFEQHQMNKNSRHALINNNFVGQSTPYEKSKDKKQRFGLSGRPSDREFQYELCQDARSYQDKNMMQDRGKFMRGA